MPDRARARIGRLGIAAAALLAALLLALPGAAVLPAPLGAAEAWAEVPVPPASARVVDLAGALSGSQRGELESTLRAFEQRKGSQVAVLILPTTQPETIEQYGIRVAEAWKPGRKNVDDGAILLVATQDRALRIEVGYGLEGALPDAIAKRIIEETIVPRFREGDLPGGVKAGVAAILKVIDGEPLPAPAQARDWSHGVARRSGNWSGGSVIGAVLAILFVGSALRRLFGHVGGSLLGSVAAAGVGWLLFGIVGAAIVAVVAFLIILFSGMSGPGLSTLRNTGGFRGGGFGGFGGGGFGGGGGGGFGGFGGGGFGGGGASGRW